MDGPPALILGLERIRNELWKETQHREIQVLYQSEYYQEYQEH